MVLTEVMVEHCSITLAETLASFKRKLQNLSVQHFVLTGFYHLLT